MLTSILFSSCSKDDSLPEPRTGYFVKSITVSESGDKSLDINFRYDSSNRIIEETLDSDTITYAYNDRGQLTNYSLNDDEIYSFEYMNNVIIKIVEHNPNTNKVTDEIPVTFSNGTYSINGEAVCKVDDQNQLLELSSDDVVFLYGEKAGVHQHLTLSPARYLIRGNELGYDLILSNKELLGWEQEGSVISMESQRNEQGLITTIMARTIFDEEYQWDIEYEQRNLVQ